MLGAVLLLEMAIQMIHFMQAYGHKLFDVLLFLPVTSSGTHKVNVFTIENRMYTFGMPGIGFKTNLVSWLFLPAQRVIQAYCQTL